MSLAEEAPPRLAQTGHYPNDLCAERFDARGLLTSSFTALSWLEFRQLAGFRDSHPRLAAWLDAFSERSSMRVTPLSGPTRD